MKPLAFVDIETTGLNSAVHEIIEITIIKVCKRHGITHYTQKIMPEYIERANQKALQINGFSYKEWANAPLALDVADEIGKILANTMLVGHNIKFDEEFISEMLHNHAVKKRYDYRTIDTITLAHEHLPHLKSISLTSLRKYFGWSIDGAHTSYVDAMDCMRLYNKLLRANWFKRTYWRIKYNIKRFLSR